MIKQAFVHGRFQPPHNQHFEYILAAKKRCSFLWIGITKYDIQEITLSPVAPHRESRFSNPLTFFERIEAISATLEKRKITRGEYGFIPIPIEQPEKITSFIDNRIQCFTTICDEWNLHKIKILESLGFSVESLIDRRHQSKDEIISGKFIRERALANDSIWKKYVPTGSLEVLEKINFTERLKQLTLKQM